MNTPVRIRKKEKRPSSSPVRPVSANLRFVVGNILFISLAGLCFTACPVEPDDEGGAVIEVSLPIDGSGGRHYYALSSGEEVAPAGGNWDIALEARDGSFFILTNSGVTTPGGQGRVWFTEKKDFDAVQWSDAVTVLTGGLSEYEPYTEDTLRYTMVMAPEPVPQTLNVMTYVGYPSGNGLGPATPFEYTAPDMGNMASFSPYLFNKKHAYTMKGMPPNYSSTMRVYVVRHGDGAACSKVQLSEVYREPGTPSLFVLRLKYAILDL
jgi:hypothetical protein